MEFPHGGSVLLGYNLNHSFECISTIKMICPSIITSGNSLLSGCYILTNLPSFEGHDVRALRLGPPSLVQGVMP